MASVWDALLPGESDETDSDVIPLRVSWSC